MYGSSGLILDSDSDTKPIDQFETKEDPMYQQTKENPIYQIETKESKEPVLPVEWGIKQPGLWDKTWTLFSLWTLYE